MSRKEDRIWSEGFARACEIAERDGLEALMAEKRFRGILGTTIRMTSSELDYASEDIKKTFMHTMEVAMLSAAHDAFGFGEKRLIKLLREFDKLSAYMANGWIYWMDLITELEQEHHIALAIKDGAEHLLQYSRPDPEDIYTELDFISKKDWDERLRFLDLMDDGKKVHDESGYIWWDYDNPYDKIQIYDILGGIEYAVRFLHATKPGDELKRFGIRKPEETAKPDKQQKKRRRRK